jgi:hypothetical protein
MPGGVGDLPPPVIGSAVDDVRSGRPYRPWASLGASLLLLGLALWTGFRGLLYAAVVLALTSFGPAWMALRNWRTTRRMARQRSREDE